MKQKKNIQLHLKIAWFENIPWLLNQKYFSKSHFCVNIMFVLKHVFAQNNRRSCRFTPLSRIILKKHEKTTCCKWSVLSNVFWLWWSLSCVEMVNQECPNELEEIELYRTLVFSIGPHLQPGISRPCLVLIQLMACKAWSTTAGEWSRMVWQDDYMIYNKKTIVPKDCCLKIVADP